MLLEDIKYLEDPAERMQTFAEFQHKRWAALGKNKELRTEAVKFLSTYLAPEKEVLKQLVLLSGTKNFTIGGRFPCTLCGNGELSRKKFCVGCFGRGMIILPPIHQGWGVEIRNALRANGFGESAWPIWSLDDYYAALIQALVVGEERMNAPEVVKPKGKRPYKKGGIWTDSTAASTGYVYKLYNNNDILPEEQR
jgi:hypothetical protein